MLANLLRGLGVSPAAIDRATQTAYRVQCDLEELKRALQLEHGRPNCELIPHNPAQIPEFEHADVGGDETVLIDAEARLGKPCTRGHIANVGDTELSLQYQGVSGDQWSADYRLPSGGVHDTSSFAWRKVRVRALDIAGRVQVQMQ